MTHTEHNDVKAFQEKFAVPMAEQPSFLTEEMFTFRFKFMHEELKEFQQAHELQDMHEMADALVDLCYVVHGTALIMGLPWQALWDEVQKKNMQKVRAVSAEQSKRKSSFDVIKPLGWTPPSHDKALGKGPWPVLGADDETD
jgi:predicted HAD superfamily Cof-like phosphohydrolase